MAKLTFRLQTGDRPRMRRVSQLMALVACILVALSGVPAAYAATRFVDAGDLPFYARDLYGSEWTVFIFYRPPACIPADFNLLAFFDPERATTCGPPTTDGFAIVGNTPNPFGAPMHLKLRGLGAVPIWFVRADEFAAVSADGVVTLGELAAIPSLLVGTATAYHEVLHPAEAKKVSKLTIVARGALDDGRSFRLHVNAVYHGEHVRSEQIQIVFSAPR